MSTKNTSTGSAGAARARSAQHSTASTTGLDLEAALSRIAGLDDEQLQDLVHDLDSALAECRGHLVSGTDMDLVSVAASARVALRRRRAAAARSRAICRIRQLTCTETTE
ncbi:hypothetical protein ACIRVK_13740 [Streptomyces sp. NPDC101152]|uniref:hypothetical protein n=1 Tax=Streptomyces sp. NPDC101152 TaxID=3366116 RepID=UPI0037F994A3